MIGSAIGIMMVGVGIILFLKMFISQIITFIKVAPATAAFFLNFIWVLVPIGFIAVGLLLLHNCKKEEGEY